MPKLGLSQGLGRSGIVAPGVITDGLVMKHMYPVGEVQPLSDGAVFLDGSNDYVNIVGMAGELSEDDAFTFSVWFLNQAADGGDSDEHEEIIFGFNNDSVNKFRLGINRNTSQITGGIYVSDANRSNTFIATDSSSATGGTDYRDEKWHHVALTRASGAGDQVAKVYVDGIQLTNAYDISGNGDTAVLDPAWGDVNLAVIGAEYDSGPALSDWYKGYLCNAGIWKRALTQSEVKSIMWKQYAGLTTTEKTDLISWWNLDADANDSHGSNNGTLS
tara:strand:- start:569 stop:1390 length:822 start_codon:yes stop_codon:yes gene_type:complete